MMREMLYASDFLDKDVLNLETGDLVGRITGLLVCEDPLRVSAFAYRVEEEKGSRLAFCSFSQVTDIDQQVVVISSSQSYLPGDAKSLLGLSCLDSTGKLLGKIRDCAWTQSDGTLRDLIIAGAEEWYGIAISDVGKLGSGAVILAVPESGIHKSAYTRQAAQSAEAEDAEEMMRSLLRRLGATLSEAGQKVGERMRQIDTDELKRDAGRFTERVAVEIRDVLDNLSEQSKSAKTANMESEIASVLRDLKGFTVTSPIYDNQGEVIIMPGHAIDETAVRRTVESDKVAELYRVAVQVTQGEDHE